MQVTDLETLRKSGRIIFECISGSHAYGTNTPESDEDIRGFFVNTRDEYLGLKEPAGQINDTKHDITFYSLKRAFELLMTANPNMIELLWMPESCIKLRSPVYDYLVMNRSLFISKKAYHTHSGYAYAQIKRAKGKNKKVHNSQPQEHPKKEDYCWFIPASKMNIPPICREDGVFPCRPIPIKDAPYLSLGCCHAAALEHTANVYRLYHYGDMAKGVFRGTDMLVCESIPKEDENSKFCGFLIYNEDAYKRAVAEWKSYWDWVKNRNDSRWLDQENGLVDFDAKNMMHCMRLLLSGENILRYGEPIVRFANEDLEYLMKIRRGEIPYDQIMDDVSRRMKILDELYNTSSIPHAIDQASIEKLYREALDQLDYGN